jgi:hypothetical protein
VGSSAFQSWLRGLRAPHAPHPNEKVTAADFLKSEAMNTEKLESHHEGWRTFMARYRGGDGHYADMECADAELERYLVLNALRVGNDT